ncbi:sigma-54 interaction domain-containing protein [Ectobacillus panaciterrae]|uniref:sigma-54 interaction domain-containing protein n=1 Tax=Ectobacillus panaciterrae TaxID=363872 RepID=UPI00041D9E00|nr:sigma-54-dependent Fis family transcriptional regulator [Ectobacillus panaciterrae]
MFKNGQINIDDSFILLEPHTPLIELKNKLLQYRFVVITGETYYIIKHSEVNFIALGADSLPAAPWLEEMQWLSSEVSTITELLEVQIDWRRPVLIENEGRERIIGIMTADEWIRHLNVKTKRLNSYFHTLAETVNDAVTAVDQEGEVICWNSAAEATYGIKRETIIGKKIGAYFHTEDIMLHHILNEGHPVRRVYHRPSSDTHVLINASPIIQDNIIIGGVATEQDITQIVRLNEELYSSLPLLVHQERPFSSIIGGSTEIQEALKIAKKTAYADIPVLLTGEPGSGKEILAQAIHYGGSRKNEPFLSINCTAVPSGFLEAELFGYQGGAFTNDEQTGQAGKLEQAHGGTLFIADIDQMPFDSQVKFSNYLEQQSFQRIGGTESVTTHTRIIAAASPAIEEMMRKGTFHKGLYYHLAVINIDIPPLRERTADIVELVQRFMKEFTIKYKKPMPDISPTLMTTLIKYNWPGNIRELRNVVERIILLNDGDVLTTEHLPKGIIVTHPQKDHDVSNQDNVLHEDPTSANEEIATIREALHKTYGNKSAAAKLLGISRGTIYNKIKEYGLDENND